MAKALVRVKAGQEVVAMTKGEAAFGVLTLISLYFFIEVLLIWCWFAVSENTFFFVDLVFMKASFVLLGLSGVTPVIGLLFKAGNILRGGATPPCQLL